MFTLSKSTHRCLYALTAVIRILSFFVIIKWPLFGWFIIFFVDTIDYFFALRGGFTFAQYQLVDKSLDILNRFYYVVPAIIFNWPVRDLFLLLFFYRLIGDFLYFKDNSEKHFFLFPNLLEFILPAYIIFNHSLILALGIGIPLKLLHEYKLHIKNFIDPFSSAYINRHPEHDRKTVNKKTEPGRQ